MIINIIQIKIAAINPFEEFMNGALALEEWKIMFVKK